MGGDFCGSQWETDTQKEVAKGLCRLTNPDSHKRLARCHLRRVNKQRLIDYLREKPGWQVIVVPRATLILEGSLQPGSPLQPRKLESAAGRASSLTIVPTGKNAVQVPEPLPRVMVQSIPAGWEVIRPLPFPPGMMEMPQLEAAKGVCTVIVEDLVIPPADAIIVEDWLLLTLFVETVKVALVDPAGTVTLAGTVAAAVLLLDNETSRPPEGAAELRVTVPVAGLPPTTVAGLRLSVESDAAEGELTVQPDNLAEAAVADPSFTFTMQSSGFAKGSLSILKFPAPSLVPIATPSTVIVRLAVARPSIRSRVPLSSARETVTAAWAVTGRASRPTRTSSPMAARRVRVPHGASRRVVMVRSFLARTSSSSVYGLYALDRRQHGHAIAPCGQPHPHTELRRRWPRRIGARRCPSVACVGWFAYPRLHPRHMAA